MPSGEMGSEHYCLRWNNHQSNLLGVFSQLLRDESLVDVTLACSEGQSIRAHKVVLSACSSYFQSLFVDHPGRHPIVILKDVRFSELRTLIEFMYKGEVNVEYCQLSALLKTAESLQVKGLAEMTREYKTFPEQMEPTELVNRRIPHQPRTLTPEETEDTHHHSPASVQNLRVCKSPLERDRERDRERDNRERDQRERENRERDIRDRDRERDVDREIKVLKDEKRPGSVENLTPPASSDCGASDMSIHNSNNLTTCSSINPTTSSICSRLPSPLNCEPLPGPSNLPPVQQVPLSLKKEVDWGGGGDDKSGGEASSDYKHLQQESDSGENNLREDSSPRLYPCMYCGNSFPHQSKLTRHILSHSLDSLKYREQRQHPAATLTMPEPLGFMDFTGRLPATPHEPPDPTDQPPTTMEMDLNDAASVGTGTSGVVLCKFCGKSFPDVGSLIAHLPIHTGDRPFKCEFCGKAFKLRHHMKDHCRVHTGERPFRCGLCGKTFSRSTILKAHEKTHYPKYVRKFLSPSPLDTEEESPH